MLHKIFKETTLLPVNPRPGVEINVSLGSLLAIWLAGWWAGELACGWLVGCVAGWVHCGVNWLDDLLNGDWLHALDSLVAAARVSPSAAPWASP